MTALALAALLAVAPVDAPPPFGELLDFTPGVIDDTADEIDQQFRTDREYRTQQVDRAVEREVRGNLRTLKLPTQRQAANEGRAALAARIEAARRAAAEKARRLTEAARRAAVERSAPVPSRTADGWVLPVSDYRLTARFGQSGSRWSRDHTGLDFAAATGTRVRAPHACEVTFAGSAGPYGNKVECDAGDVEFWFAHLSAFDVSVGEDVATGDLIGRVGATGNVTGPHLHLEIHDGSGAVDPDAYLSSKGVSP